MIKSHLKRWLFWLLGISICGGILVKRLCFSIITLLVVILISSCGGIQSDNINYTKYNGYSSTSKTTEKSTKPSTNTRKSETVVSKSTVKNSVNKTVVVSDNKNGVNKSKKIKEKRKNTTVVDKIGYNNADNFKISTTITEKTELLKERIKIKTTVQTTSLPTLLDTDFCYITENGKKFHRENCRYLYKSNIKIIVKEAKDKGFSPCSVCKPQ